MTVLPRVEHFHGHSAPDREPPAPGYLLDELGYVDEIEAAAGLDITPKTLIRYRQAGVGPRHTELARKIFYSREAIAAWLASGGVREP